MFSVLPHLLSVLAVFGASAQTMAVAPDRAISASDQAAIRCSVAFAIVAGRQVQGQPGSYPPLAWRGREYMVVTGTRLIDTGWSETDVAAAMRNAAAGLRAEDVLASVMGPCLSLLDAEVPALQKPNPPQCIAILQAQAAVVEADLLERRVRGDAAAQGRTPAEIDAVLAMEADAVAKVAAMPGGLDRFDAAACLELAKG